MRPLAAREPRLDERQQYLVLLVRVVTEGTGRPGCAELGASKGNGCRDRLHGVFLPWLSCNAGLYLAVVSSGKGLDDAAAFGRHCSPFVMVVVT
jgi:hypothetical protein